MKEAQNKKGMDKVLNLIQSNPKLEDLHIELDYNY